MYLRSSKNFPTPSSPRTRLSSSSPSAGLATDAPVIGKRFTKNHLLRGRRAPAGLFMTTNRTTSAVPLISNSTATSHDVREGPEGDTSDGCWYGFDLYRFDLAVAGTDGHYFSRSGSWIRARSSLSWSRTDSSLSTFYTFDKENGGQASLAQQLKLARGGGCGGCGCGPGGGCGGEVAAALQVSVAALQVSVAGAAMVTCTLQMRIFQTLLRLRLQWLRRLLGLRNLLDMDTHLGLDQHLPGRIYACGWRISRRVGADRTDSRG
jgi:hypothetical protein